MSDTPKLLALVTALLFGSTTSFAEAPTSTIDRISAPYLDYANRLRGAVKDNSIALLMLADSLRSGEATSEKVVAILTDHKKGISGLDSFRARRHTITFKGAANGELSASGLIEKLPGTGASVAAGFDFEIVRHSRELIPISGREQAQTGYDYVIGDATLVPKACGSLTGRVKAPAVGLADAKVEASSTMCYEYSPSSMTALGGYIAKNQDRLVRLEKQGGEDLVYLTDRLYAYYSRTCEKAECSAIEKHLAGLKDAGLGLELPASVRTKKEIRADALTDPLIGVLLDDNETTRNQIIAIEKDIGRQFSDKEKALLALTKTDGKIFSALSDVQKEQLRQGKLLDLLSEPGVQVKMMVNAMLGAQERLRERQKTMKNFLLSSFYGNLTDDQKRAKFALELERIEDGYKQIGAYTYAAQNTLMLIGALSSASSETQRDIQKGFAVISAANEMVKAGLILQNAVHADVLRSTAAVGAYASGAGAVLTMISLFSGGGKSELQGLSDYIGARLDAVDKKLDLLHEQSVALHQKVDMLLQGQRAITEIVIENASAIHANRIEQAAIAESIDIVRRQMRELGLSIDKGFADASLERSVFFDAELRRDQEQAIINAEIDLKAWLNSDADVIKRLNKGDRSAQLVDAVRIGRQKVLDLIGRLSGPVFVRPLEVIARKDDVERPPVHGLAALPDKAREVAALTAFYRDFRTPHAGYSVVGLENTRKADEELASIQAAAFPVINASAFDDLPNPDALLQVLESYLTFVLALTPEAREAIGFSDLPRIVALIERLSASKREAQAATFALFAASRDSLAWMNEELEGISSQPGLFSQRDSLADYFFRPKRLRSWRGDLNEAELDQFASRAAANAVALDWIAQHGRPYIERGLREDVQTLLALIAHIKQTGSWRLPADHPVLDSRGDSAYALRRNLRLLEDLRALLNAYDAGELFEYSDDEIAAFDQVASKPVLSDNDIAALISLIKSPASLVELANDEKLIRYTITPENEPFDLDPKTAEVTRIYGTVAHVTYHSGTQSWSQDGFLGFGSKSYSLSYGCKGAEIRIAPGMEGVYRGPTSFAFPTDTGVNVMLGGQAVLAANAVMDCATVAQNKRMTVPHPEPYGKFTGTDYWEITRDPGFSPQSFKRDAAMVPDGTKLFETATSRCVLKAKWNDVSLAQWNVKLDPTRGIDIAQPIASLANFVERTLDNPLVFESQKVVDQEIAEQFSHDNQPLRPRLVDCEAYGEHASQKVAPELPQLGKRRPAQLIEANWHFVDGGKIAIAPGFRAGLISALQVRRAAINDEVLERSGNLFREPEVWLDYMLNKMEFAGGAGDQRKDVVAAFNSGGRSAFFNHPVIAEFQRAHAEAFEKASRLDQFYRQRHNQISLLQTFAEWGLGECLFTVPQYQPLATLFWEPVGTADLAVPRAIRVLQNPRGSGQYPYAAAALKEGTSRLESRITAFGDFPPKPKLTYSSYNHLYKDYAIDATAALAIAENTECRPGHKTINALEDLLVLMRDQGLIPAAPRGR